MIKEIIDSDGKLVYTDLMETCHECLFQYSGIGTSNVVCSIDGNTKRIAHIVNRHGKMFACSYGSKTKHNFMAELEALKIGQQYFNGISKKIVKETLEDEKNRVIRLEHNLKTLNGQCLQLMENIVPQHLFLKNIHASEVVTTVENIISTKIRETALTSLKLVKHLMSVKSELLVYDIIFQSDVKLQKENHKVRDVLMLVLYKFFGELYDKNVFVDVDNYYEWGYFDFDTVNVALYYIVENISKYICPDTTIKVHLNKTSTMNVISFEMRSLHVDKDEEGKIFHKGYSGKAAKQMSLSGEGLGMYQAHRLLEMNEAKIDFVAGEQCFTINNLDYSDNTINVELPLAQEI